MTSQPFVSIVSPVYNEAEYLAECIESVLAQTYQNWDYTIVDNCSSDGSFDIAQSYAKRDPRIRVIRNDRFVTAIENHNIAFHCISPKSVYCKLLSGDDWLYPDFISKLVELAERNPALGMIASYAITTHGVRWGAIPLDKNAFNGRDIGRLFLLGLIDSFWVPSTVIYRSSLVRAKEDFFPGDASSADLSACLDCLKETDFGFVHQILSFERMHEASVSARVGRLGGYLLDRIHVLNETWTAFLTHEEYARRLDVLLDEYYGNVLAVSCFNSRNREFWDFHRQRLKTLGYPLLSKRLVKAVLTKTFDLVFNPKQTLEKVIGRINASARNAGTRNHAYCDPVYRR
jgi:glycosyltransferase involved in cell wall biosynthesis